MDFEKKYPITQQPGDYVLVQWTRGYREVDVYYKGQLVGEVTGVGKLKTGTSIATDLLGIIQLKLSEKPITLDVIVDGYHSPVNVSHPVKELKKTATFFWIIAVFAFIAGAIEVGLFSGWKEIAAVLFLVNLVIFLCYLFAAIFVGKGHIWAYYLGLSVFAFSTLVTLIALFSGVVWGTLLYLMLFIRLGTLGVLLYNLKTAISAGKHKRFKEVHVDELLDSKF